MINKFDETNSFFYENGFYLTSQPYRLGNILAHYEIYKMVSNLPGGVMEIGVFKGGSLIQWATFRELLENEKSRKIVGFDVFGPFPETNKIQSDKVFIRNWNYQFANDFISEDEIIASLKLKNIGNVHLIKGDVCDTIPKYLNDNPAFRISLLHIDTDVYDPCKVVLDHCWDRIVPGGVILFDDYATIEGETVAIEEFIEGKGIILNKFPFSHEKPSFLIKK